MSKRVSITAVLVIALSLAWLVPASVADTVRVRATGSESEGWRWRPATRHAAQGDRVVWRNPTDRTHTVTAYSNNWSKNTQVGSGERTSKTFRRTGTYKYRCTVQGHSALNNGRCVGMCGKIVVHQ
jgi:plastocyanin